MTPADAPETIQWITNQYGFDPEEVRQWVHHLHFNWPLSVKAINPDGHTIGLLNMSNYRIEEETESIVARQPDLLARDLQQFDFVFIPVMHRLKTHLYWQRWGAREFFRDNFSIYYMLPLSPQAKDLTSQLPIPPASAQ